MNVAYLVLCKEGRLVDHTCMFLTSQRYLFLTWVWQNASIIMITGYVEFFFSQTRGALFSVSENMAHDHLHSVAFTSASYRFLKKFCDRHVMVRI